MPVCPAPYWNNTFCLLWCLKSNANLICLNESILKSRYTPAACSVPAVCISILFHTMNLMYRTNRDKRRVLRVHGNFPFCHRASGILFLHHVLWGSSWVYSFTSGTEKIFQPSAFKMKGQGKDMHISYLVPCSGSMAGCEQLH